jgi:hypothetical protein
MANQTAARCDSKGRPHGWRRLAAPLVVLGSLGLVSIRYPQLLGNGKDISEILFTATPGLALLLPLLMLKPAATALCMASGSNPPGAKAGFKLMASVDQAKILHDFGRRFGIRESDVGRIFNRTFSDGRKLALDADANSRLDEIEANLPGGFQVHLVMDNYGTHKVAKVRGWLARHPRYHVHFTPTSGSWLNLVERLFSDVTERCVRRGSHTAVRALEKAMLDYLDQRNKNPKPFVWTKNRYGDGSRFMI